GMVQSELDGTIVWANERWHQLIGPGIRLPLPMDDLLALVHPDDRERLADLYRRTIETLEEFTTEVAILRADDGSVRHQRLRVAPLLDAAGRPTGLAGSVADITDLVEARDTSRQGEARYRRLLL